MTILNVATFWKKARKLQKRFKKSIQNKEMYSFLVLNWYSVQGNDVGI
jgi:hypothetical protein